MTKLKNKNFRSKFFWKWNVFIYHLTKINDLLKYIKKNKLTYSTFYFTTNWNQNNKGILDFNWKVWVITFLINIKNSHEIPTNKKNIILNSIDKIEFNKKKIKLELKKLWFLIKKNKKSDFINIKK